MSLAVAYVQDLDPIGNRIISTAQAALPVLVLFYLLVPRRWLASKAGAAGGVVAILIAWLAYNMPLDMAVASFVHGAAFGILPVGWTVFCAMLVYNLTVETGQFTNIRRSISGLSGDGRVQAVLIGFCFGAFLEGAAGSGSPVAVCGAMLVGLGFPPLRAAVICLIANTSPVAYGGLGTPILVLSSVTDLPGENLSVMAGRQLPFLSVLVPFYMVKVMCSWRQTFEVLPALLVGGGSFAFFQWVFSAFHTFPFVKGMVVFHITDVAASILSMIILAVFLKFWKPRNPWHFDKAPVPAPDALPNPHGSEADDFKLDLRDEVYTPLTGWQIAKAWMPYALMSICLMLTGVVRQLESKGDVWIVPGILKTRYLIDIPTLHKESQRAERLLKPVPTAVPAASAVAMFGDPIGQAAMVVLTSAQANPANTNPVRLHESESAQFNFVWVSSAGTPVFASAILSALLLRMSRRQILTVIRKTFIQMKVPIPTIACMLGLSYVTRYAGMDATLGIAFAGTGLAYPFFAAILGWLGVFLTGTDAGSNALFGSLQKITATEVWNDHHVGAMHNLSLEQAQTLICTANSTGGVMGKMIDAQSICVATAGTNQIGREADIFKAVVWHSILLAAVVGLMTLVQAYVFPFTQMVPG
jgi:lactate permease